MITHRELPLAEWGKLTAFPPFDKYGLPQNPEHWRICVVEDDDQIVGLSCVFTAVHWDMFHVEEDYRGNPVVVKGLIVEGIRVLKDAGVAGVFAVVDQNQPEAHHALMRHFGFTQASGTLYSADIANLPEVE